MATFFVFTIAALIYAGVALHKKGHYGLEKIAFGAFILLILWAPKWGYDEGGKPAPHGIPLTRYEYTTSQVRNSP